MEYGRSFVGGESMVIFKGQNRLLNFGAVFFLSVSIVFNVSNQLPAPWIKLTNTFHFWVGYLFSLLNQFAIGYLAAWIIYRLTIFKEYEYSQRRQRDLFAYHLAKVEANYDLFEIQSGLNLASESPLEFAVDLVGQRSPGSKAVMLAGADVTHCSIEGDTLELIDRWYCLSCELLEKAISLFETLSPVGSDMLRERLNSHQSNIVDSSSVQEKIAVIKTFVHDDVPKIVDAAMRQRLNPVSIVEAVRKMREFHISNVEPMIEWRHPRIIFSRKLR